MKLDPKALEGGLKLLRMAIEAGDPMHELRLRVDDLLKDVAALSRIDGEGWRRVPVEPTEAMMVAGGLKCEAIMFEGDPDGTGVIFKDMGHVYRAMLAAAPSPSIEDPTP